MIVRGIHVNFNHNYIIISRVFIFCACLFKKGVFLMLTKILPNANLYTLQKWLLFSNHSRFFNSVFLNLQVMCSGLLRYQKNIISESVFILKPLSRFCPNNFGFECMTLLTILQALIRLDLFYA